MSHCAGREHVAFRRQFFFCRTHDLHDFHETFMMTPDGVITSTSVHAYTYEDILGSYFIVCKFNFRGEPGP